MNPKYRLFSLFFVALLLLGTTISLPATPVLALTEAPIPVIISYTFSPGLCFQVGNSVSDTQNGAPVIIRQCNYDNTIYQPVANQSFTIENMGPNLYAIRAKHSNKCLMFASNSSANGVPLVQTTCTTGTYWYFDANGSSFTFRSPFTNKCMFSNYFFDDYGNVDGVVQKECDQPVHRSFLPIPAGIGVRVKSLHSWKCLDVNNSGGGMQNGANLQQWDCLGYNQTNQRFNLRLKPGYHRVKLMAVHSGKCLKHPGSSSNGSQVKQYTCIPDDDIDDWSQWWSVSAAGISPAGIHYVLYQDHVADPYGPKALDLNTAGSGAGLQNGAKVQTWDLLGGSNQLWLFKQITP
jgi:hypothetical protein